jgi:6-phosphogluconolactonase
MKPNLHIFETPEDTARAVAELILTKSKEKNKLSLPLNIAVSGGNTPKLLFTILSSDYLESIPWHFIRIFWVDERCVSPTHPESNFGMTYKSLLKNVPVHETNIFRIQGENNPQTEALRYQALLEKELPQKNGFPKFDLILLGMGDDGHTASIFPHEMNLLNSNKSVSVGVHPESAQNRVTLTGKTLNQADHVVFFITGASKAKVLNKIIHQDPSSEKFPTTFVYSNSGETDFYLDKLAATKL